VRPAEASPEHRSNRSTAQATAARNAGAPPQSLTTHDVLELQRTAGNRAVARILTSTLQRKPVPKDGSYVDDTYVDVMFEALKDRSTYRVTSSKGQGTVLYYEAERGVYTTTEDLGKFGYSTTGEVFDIASLSSGGAVVTKPKLRFDVGADGKGVANVEAKTTLSTSGLLSCVGWLLHNDRAAYLTHIVVLEPTKVPADGRIRAQVEALHTQFVEVAGGKPTRVVVMVDKGNPAYAKGGVQALAWSDELVPSGLTSATDWLFGADLEHVVEPVGSADAGPRKEWDGKPINVESTIQD
jgi:hypothetical protein